MLARLSAGLAAASLIASTQLPWAMAYARNAPSQTAVPPPKLFTEDFNIFTVLFFLAALVLVLSALAPGRMHFRLAIAALAVLAIAWLGAAIPTLFPFVLGGLPGSGFVPAGGFVISGIGLVLTAVAARTAAASE